MLITNVFTLMSSKTQTIANQQLRQSFGSSVEQDTFVSNRRQKVNRTLSFSGLIPDYVLKLYAKEEETEKLNALKEKLLNSDSSTFNEILNNADITLEEKAQVKFMVIDTLMENIAMTRDWKEQDQLVLKLTNFELVAEFLERNRKYMVESSDDPTKHEVMFESALSALLGERNPDVGFVIYQIQKLIDSTQDPELRAGCERTIESVGNWVVR